jgi:hypothetical protein
MQQAELVVEPDDGIAPTLNAIRHAKKAIDLTIFRFDQLDVANALAAAVTRGVQVRALIACSNRGGVHHLRRLEWRLLEAGVTVGRSNHDLERYHAKLMIVDNRALHVYGFNFTRADLDSRSFGIITTARRLVQQAMRLFDADLAHRPFDGADEKGLVVSPENARERLEHFIQGARRELLIYDAKLGDRRMLRQLAERARAGVAVRIIGHIGKDAGKGSRYAAGISTATDVSLRSRMSGCWPASRTTARTVTAAMSASRNSTTAACTCAPSCVTGRSRSSAVRACAQRSSTPARGRMFVNEPEVVRQIRDTFERDWPAESARVTEAAWQSFQD